MSAALAETAKVVANNAANAKRDNRIMGFLKDSRRRGVASLDAWSEHGKLPPTRQQSFKENPRSCLKFRQKSFQRRAYLAALVGYRCLQHLLGDAFR